MVFFLQEGRSGMSDNLAVEGYMVGEIKLEKNIPFDQISALMNVLRSFETHRWTDMRFICLQGIGIDKFEVTFTYLIDEPGQRACNQILDQIRLVLEILFGPVYRANGSTYPRYVLDITGSFIDITL